ncbi:peptidoglycan-binding protein [Streptomyces sp. NPDC058405]|uniref:peptidoglycan-binding protein n=1 Tax=Streptomyces sp. NPDC058405 TaxID=3346482 RepID=UPI00364BBF66
MTVPVFEEYEPAPDCPCAGCAERRRERARGLPVRAGGHPAAHGARRALVLATAAGVALGATGFAHADTVAGRVADAEAGRAAGPEAGRVADVDTGRGADPDVNPDPATPQGGSGPLHGQPLPGPGSTPQAPMLRPSTRADIINRAKRWVNAKVPYSMDTYWSDGYRKDCSGFVSMAWNLVGNEWTGSLAQFGVKIAREDLEAGDILLFHNPSDPNKGSHVTVFGGWTEYTHTYYLAYEQTQPHTRSQSTPLAYWSNSDLYVAYRYKGLNEGLDGKGPGAGTGAGTGTGAGPGTSAASAAYPGAGSFGPGATNKHVTRLGDMLASRGGKRFYGQGPGPRWGDADRRATQAFQLAQGWRGTAANGLPGPATWRYLVNHLGKDIPAAGKAGSGTAATGGSAAATGGSTGAGGNSAGSGTGGGTGSGTAKTPPFPGAEFFRPGRSSTYVEQLGKQLVKKGFGKYYVTGPGRRWAEADRRNVEAFQRAQGWRGTSANGYPGPQTWRRLFA